jgi:hypothetical protein
VTDVLRAVSTSGREPRRAQRRSHKAVAIFAFSVETLGATNDSEQFVIGQRPSTRRPALCHQLDYTFRTLELSSVCFTDSRCIVRFRRSVDATAAGFDVAKSADMCFTPMRCLLAARVRHLNCSGRLNAGSLGVAICHNLCGPW